MKEYFNHNFVVTKGFFKSSKKDIDYVIVVFFYKLCFLFKDILHQVSYSGRGIFGLFNPEYKHFMSNPLYKLGEVIETWTWKKIHKMDV